jgi:RimJ/RimL family protein N-acetyltransferase
MTAEILVESGRLCLRRPAESDMPLFERVFCATDMMRYLGVAWTPGEAAATLREWRDAWGAGRLWCGVLVKKDGREAVGTAGLTVDTVDGEPGLELSWFVVPSHQRQGYATEIGRELLRYAFEESGATRVVAETHPGNEPASGTLERLGFRRLGERRQSYDHLPGCDRWVLWESIGDGRTAAPRG